jgi:hypothetical protein
MTVILIQQSITTASMDVIHHDLSSKLSAHFRWPMSLHLLPSAANASPVCTSIVQLDVNGIRQAGHKSFYSFQEPWTLITHELSIVNYSDHKYALLLASETVTAKKCFRLFGFQIPRKNSAKSKVCQSKAVPSTISYQKILTLPTNQVDSLVLLFRSKSDRQHWIDKITLFTGRQPFDTAQLFPFCPRNSSLGYGRSHKYGHTLFEDLKYVSTLSSELQGKQSMSTSESLQCIAPRQRNGGSTFKKQPSRCKNTPQRYWSMLCGMNNSFQHGKPNSCVASIMRTDHSDNSSPKLRKLVRFRSVESLISMHEQNDEQLKSDSAHIIFGPDGVKLGAKRLLLAKPSTRSRTSIPETSIHRNISG